MEEESVSNIRESARNFLKSNRRFHKHEESDFRRSVTNESITPEKIEAIANKLKTKSFISVSELQTLKNGLIEDTKYIEIILSTHGSLRGLVRELTGKEIRKQCEAAGCFCNIGLADSKACSVVAKVAGPYLVATLDSLSTELAVTSTWALGNLASTAKSATLLTAQGALTKLCELLTKSNAELAEAALYALVHFCYNLRDDLRADHLTKTLESIFKLPANVSSYQLLFILSCHKDFDQVLQEIQLHKILEALPISIQNHLKTCLNECSKDCYLKYVFRTLANINVNDGIYKLYLNNFRSIVKELRILILNQDVISQSLLWLIGNLFNFKSDDLFFNDLLS